METRYTSSGVTMNSSYLILDLETEIQEYLGRKGSAWVNEVVALSVSNGVERDTQYINNDEKFNALEIDEDVLVAFNAKFELSYLWGQESFQNFLTKGGRIFDSQLFEYIKSGFTYSYPGLRDVAVNLYKLKERTKWIEYYLFDKKNTLKKLEVVLENTISEETMYSLQEEINDVEYCIKMRDVPKLKVIEDVTNDVKDTENIYKQQSKFIEVEQIGKITEVFMDSLLATTEMEMNGFKVNKVFLEEQNTLLQNQIEKDKIKLEEIIKTYWDAPIEFNPNSTPHIGILLGSGGITVTTKMPKLDHDGNVIKTKQGEVKLYNTPIIYTVRGFNLNTKLLPRTKTGKISISSKTLEALSKYEANTQREKDAVTFCHLLPSYRDKMKDKNTYFQGLLDRIYPDGCVRSQYQHVKTKTGRLSSKDPNLQNLTGKAL